jgi:hypothetical protein
MYGLTGDWILEKINNMDSKSIENIQWKHTEKRNRILYKYVMISEEDNWNPKRGEQREW